MPAARTVSEDLDACGGDANRVLELRRKGAVTRDRGPAIREYLHLRLAKIDHRFDREDHAWLEDSAIALRSVMQNVGLVMELETHAMTAKIADHATALAFGKHLDCMANIAHGCAG